MAKPKIEKAAENPNHMKEQHIRYKYITTDERTRICYREIYDEHGTYSSKDFLIVQYTQTAIGNIMDRSKNIHTAAYSLMQIISNLPTFAK